MDLGRLAILTLVAYLVGALPTGLIIGKLHGVDLRQHGSGKIGATNVNRVVGRRAALVVFILDGLKGMVPVLLARLFMDGDADRQALAIACTACAALLGHIWSLWIRMFTGSWGGGRGVATAIGTMLVVNPWVSLFGLAIGIPLMIRTGYVSLGSIVGIASGGVLMLVLVVLDRLSPWLAVYALVCGSLVIILHYDNIQRLLAGTERKSTLSRAPAPPPDGPNH